MTSSKRQALAATTTATALIAGLLAGCTGGPSITRVDPTTTPASVAPQEPDADSGATPTTSRFATDDDALDAATAHYELYLATSVAILSDGGANPERLRPLVSSEVYDTELRAFDRAASQGFRLEGAPELLDTSLQQRTTDPDTAVERVTFTACLSRENLRIVYDNGDVAPLPEAPPRYARTIAITFTPDGPIYTGDSEADPTVDC
ncbi:MAG TPA: hypothetical protein VFM95_04230 [Microcella sp.]|nr:hypothetical protein [Microcella sp.]